MNTQKKLDHNRFNQSDCTIAMESTHATLTFEVKDFLLTSRPARQTPCRCTWSWPRSSRTFPD